MGWKPRGQRCLGRSPKKRRGTLGDNYDDDGDDKKFNEFCSYQPVQDGCLVPNMWPFRYHMTSLCAWCTWWILFVKVNNYSDISVWQPSVGGNWGFVIEPAMRDSRFSGRRRCLCSFYCNSAWTCSFIPTFRRNVLPLFRFEMTSAIRNCNSLSWNSEATHNVNKTSLQNGPFYGACAQNHCQHVWCSMNFVVRWMKFEVLAYRTNLHNISFNKLGSSSSRLLGCCCQLFWSIQENDRDQKLEESKGKRGHCATLHSLVYCGEGISFLLKVLGNTRFSFYS
jgi:hypothetical protein